MEKCLPLIITNEMYKKYPSCWEQIKKFRTEKEKGNLSWDDKCYIPIAATLSIVTNGEYDPLLSLEKATDTQFLAVTASWRLYKQIYSFSPEMEQLLFEQADDCAIPVEILNNLPYPCVYVNVKILIG